MADDLGTRFANPYLPELSSVGRPTVQNREGRGGLSTSRAPDCDLPTYYVASWKGVEFFVDSTSDEFGRRGDVYEYPLSDWIGYKDLGRRARRFKVEGYIIGADQVAKSRRLRDFADSAEPGVYTHPMFGDIAVACISCTLNAEYRKEKKRTRVSFEFVEAGPSMAPYGAGQSPSDVMNATNLAVEIAKIITSSWWRPELEGQEWLDDINTNLSSELDPKDERGHDNKDALQPEWNDDLVSGGITRMQALREQARGVLPRGVMPMAEIDYQKQYEQFIGVTYQQVISPINIGISEIRRMHLDALKRLKDFNSFVVQRSQPPLVTSVQALVITTRLAIARDFAVAASVKGYRTIKEALDDLDWLMQLYDEEEEIATQHCDDSLVNAIGKARAIAAEVILGRAVRLPGIGQYNVDGVWPSLVVAQKLYNDGRRFQQVEDYNQTMSTFFMGRGVIGLSR